MESDTPTADATPTSWHERIARRAYFLWEDFGRPSGCDLDIWLLAESTMPTRRHAQDDLVESDFLPLTWAEGNVAGVGSSQP